MEKRKASQNPRGASSDQRKRQTAGSRTGSRTRSTSQSYSSSQSREVSRTRTSSQSRSTSRTENRTRTKGSKIRVMPHASRFSVVAVLFAFVLLYIIVSLFRVTARKTYASFQVALPETQVYSDAYKALIVRQEQIITSPYSGSADYFVSAGDHVRVGTLLASIDEVGSFSETLREAEATMVPDRDTLLRFKEQLRQIGTDYDPQNLNGLYEQYTRMKNATVGTVHTSSLEALEDDSSMQEFFHRVYTMAGGLVSFYYDGFESFQPTQVKASDFDEKTYTRTASASLVAAGDFLYKVTRSEEWMLILPLTKTQASLYTAESRLQLTFLRNNLSTTGASMVFTGADGNYYLQITLDRYMVQFSQDRFVSVRIELPGASGYKIPESCLTEVRFYQVPKNCLDPGANSSELGFNLVTYDSAGRESGSSFVEAPAIYYSDDEYYYFYEGDLTAGTVMTVRDSPLRFTIRQTVALKGVYDIDTGYALFRPVTIQQEADDYVWIVQGTYRGISAYDTLLLDADDYQFGQLMH